jgi:hypothetical protein
MRLRDLYRLVKDTSHSLHFSPKNLQLFYIYVDLETKQAGFRLIAGPYMLGGNQYRAGASETIHDLFSSLMRGNGYRVATA